MNYEVLNPDPSALIEALRSLGYNLPTAIADIIDNSITAGAEIVSIEMHWAGKDSHICILDDGKGMSEEELSEAMRPGSTHPLEHRAPDDLGRFGLGLKTASFSQCRELCVVSKVEGGIPAVRTWDLDYVARTKEWRLRKEPTIAAEIWLKKLAVQTRGTAVVWSNLDRLVGRTTSEDSAVQNKFLDAIDHVREHLALTFHRFLEDDSLSLIINKDNKVAPWNPFMKGNPATTPTPDECIPVGKSGVRVKGFVLPHKDKLSEEEYKANAGPRGWNGGQGFYIYRNRRLLIYGDWLRLGRPKSWTREEQYKLARLRLDIDNDADSDWHLDVKKSTARPPIIIRERLTDLAIKVRSDARTVFAHRGRYGARTNKITDFERPWIPRLRNGQQVYLIDRSHPMVSGVIKKCGTAGIGIDSLLRFLEETVPVQQIWLDSAEQGHDPAPPYDGVNFADIRTDIRMVFGSLLDEGIDPEKARQRIAAMEPFNRYPDITTKL